MVHAGYKQGMADSIRFALHLCYINGGEGRGRGERTSLKAPSLSSTNILHIGGDIGLCRTLKLYTMIPLYYSYR